MAGSLGLEEAAPSIPQERARQYGPVDTVFIQIKLQDSSVSFVDTSFSQRAFFSHKLEKGVGGFIQEAETTQSLASSEFQDTLGRSQPPDK